MNEQQPYLYANAHTAWLVCLFTLMNKSRREGLIAIERDIESHEGSPAFVLFPQTQEQPYCEFATDILRMMVAGNLDPVNLEVYANHYIAGLMTSKDTFPSGVDESLLWTIWLTLWAAMCGYAPQVAVEFGRQGVPVKLKPSFIELEGLVKEFRAASFQRNKFGDYNAAIADFIASLN